MDKNTDAILFAVNEKAKYACNEMSKYQHSIDSAVLNKLNFWHGQYLAYCEVYSLIKNTLK